MSTAGEWPDTYAPGTPDWFEALKKKLAEIEAGDPPASALAEHVKTQQEADLLVELVVRAKNQVDGPIQAEGGV